LHVIADGRYEELIHGCRKRAATHAARRELPYAFRELQSSWELSRADAVEAGSDVAWVHLLAGDPRSALAMLSIVTRGRRRLTRRARDLIAASVALDRSLWIEALALCLARSSIVDRLRVATSVVRVRIVSGRERAP
jgi:hypothetical protein